MEGGFGGGGELVLADLLLMANAPFGAMSAVETKAAGFGTALVRPVCPDFFIFSRKGCFFLSLVM
jgi:hypothetical protein